MSQEGGQTIEDRRPHAMNQLGILMQIAIPSHMNPFRLDLPTNIIVYYFIIVCVAFCSLWMTCSCNQNQDQDQLIMHAEKHHKRIQSSSTIMHTSRGTITTNHCENIKEYPSRYSTETLNILITVCFRYLNSGLVLNK